METLAHVLAVCAVALTLTACTYAFTKMMPWMRPGKEQVACVVGGMMIAGMLLLAGVFIANHMRPIPPLQVTGFVLRTPPSQTAPHGQSRTPQIPGVPL